MPYNEEDLSPLVRRQIRLSNVPRRFLGLSMDDLSPYEGEILALCEDWTTALSEGRIIMADGKPSCGVGLLMLGKPGHGKTTLAATLLQHIVQNVPNEAWRPQEGVRITRPVYFASYPDILRISGRAIQDNRGDDAELMKCLFGESEDPSANIRVLFLDDLGKEHRTASHWAETLFDHLLRRRYDLGLPTVITSNVPLTQWATAYGESMASFAHEAFTSSVIISPKGDRRQ